jgi:hypothetical protein
MPKAKVLSGEGLSPEVLEKALLLACQQISEGSQCYEEVTTADGWYEVFVKKAKSDTLPPPVTI